MRSRGKSIQGIGDSVCKGPEVGKSMKGNWLGEPWWRWGKWLDSRDTWKGAQARKPH